MSLWNAKTDKSILTDNLTLLGGLLCLLMHKAMTELNARNLITRVASKMSRPATNIMRHQL
jgi:hypothetical protein